MNLSPDLRPLPEAPALLEDLRERPEGRLGSDVVLLLRAWRLDVTECEEIPGTFHAVHVCFQTLQMDVPRAGYVASFVVNRAIGLVDSLRVRLASVTFAVVEERS